MSFNSRHSLCTFAVCGFKLGVPMSQVIQRQENVIFGSAGGRSLHCDVLLPTAPSPHRAAVMLIHGGSWIRGDKNTMQGQAEYLADLGYVCMCIEYRFITDAAWPAPLHDAKAGLRW